MITHLYTEPLISHILVYASGYIGSVVFKQTLVTMRKSVNVPSDRFIPFRNNKRIETAGFLIKKCDAEENNVYFNTRPNKSFINSALCKWKKENFQNLLAESVGIYDNKILDISKSAGSNRKKETKAYCESTWPVSPRTKPLISTPIKVVSLPSLDTSFCHHVADWSNKGSLAFICGDEVYISNLANRYRFVTKLWNVKGCCVQWNKSATKLGMGSKQSFILIMDSYKWEVVHKNKCQCGELCDVTTLEWSSTDCLISGCSQGGICVWSQNLCIIRVLYPAHSQSIVKVALSNNERFLASASIDTKVRIWFWPTLSENFEIKCVSTIRSFAWHPWKESLLAIGGHAGEGTITLWNAASRTKVAEKPALKDSFIDDITWNCITGELVVSYWNPNPGNINSANPYLSGKSVVVVFSDLYKEVDMIQYHKGSVLYLLWGNNGTQLGTGGTDEIFCVWDFLGSSKERDRKVKLYERRKEAKGSVISKFTLQAFNQSLWLS